MARGVVAFGSSGRDVKGLGPNSFVKRRNRYSRVYCGGTLKHGGTLRSCRRALARSLKAALHVSTSKLYGDEVCSDYGRPNQQTCFDAVRQRPIGAIQQQLIQWINRPTFQQTVEIKSRAPR